MCWILFAFSRICHPLLVLSELVHIISSVGYLNENTVNGKCTLIFDTCLIYTNNIFSVLLTSCFTFTSAEGRKEKGGKVVLTEKCSAPLWS